MRQRAALNVLKLAAYRYAVRDTAGADSSLRRELPQEMRGCFTFNGRIGRKDHLAYDPFVENGLELAHAQLFRTDTVERRQVSHQHEIPAPITARLLDRDYIGWRLDDTQQRRVAMRRRTGRAKRLFRKHAATSASHNRLQRNIQ